MMYMQSTATNNGSARITVYFNQGTDPDMAQVNVQNCVTQAQGLLPAEVTQVGGDNPEASDFDADGILGV